MCSILNKKPYVNAIKAIMAVNVQETWIKTRQKYLKQTLLNTIKSIKFKYMLKRLTHTKDNTRVMPVTEVAVL